MNLSQVITEFIKFLGIEYCFGIPGSNAELLYEIEKEKSIKLILTKHENNAVFMATGITKSTGKIAACFGSQGPGALNMVEGIAAAYHDSQPILVLVGEVPRKLHGKNAFQETSGKGDTVNQYEVLKKVTKFCARITDKNYHNIQNILNKVYNSLVLDPGPVCLCMNSDIMSEEVKKFDLKKLKIENKIQYIPNKKIIKVTNLLEKETKIAILCGYGCIISNTSNLIKRLSKTHHVPIITTLKGKGIVSEDYSLNFGCVGLCGTEKANELAKDIKVLIVLGASLSQFTTNNYSFFKDTEIIRVDLKKREHFNKKEIFIKADIGDFLTELFKKLKKNEGIIKKRKKWLEKFKSIKEKQVFPYYKGKLRPSYFVYSLREYVSRNSILCTESVEWTEEYFKIYKPRTHIVSSGLAPIGCSLPEAIGCKLANPKKIVISLQGDGGFHMCGMELMTAVNYKVPIISVVLNNQVLGPIFLHQKRKYKKSFFSTFINPNFKKLAESFGIEYFKIKSIEDIKNKFPLIIKLNKRGKIVLVDVEVTPYERWP